MMLALGASPGMAQSRAHVYLLRGLMNIFSLGMDDSAARKSSKRGVYATVHNHAEWQSLANSAIARYKAGTRRSDHPDRSFAGRRRGDGDGELSRREGRAGGAGRAV